MTNHATVCEFHWRGLDMTVQYDHEHSPSGKDRFFIKASGPFYPNGPDYLVRWPTTLDVAHTEQDVKELAEMWLTDALDNSSKWQDADVKRNQLTLF